MTREIPDAPQFESARKLHPFWMRMLNRVGGILPGSRRSLDADALWRAAAKKAGGVAGEARAEVRSGLSALCASLEADAELNWVGRFAARDDTLRLAATHLRIERARAAESSLDDTELPPVTFILGLPRTGTTVLHQLLAQDPALRTIPYWESFDPVAPAAGEPDRRPQKVEKMLGQLDAIVPQIQAIHPMAATAPEECVALFMNVFRTLQFDIQYRIPGYADWLLAQDATIAYRGYREQLQRIWRDRPMGERFLLKDPTHIVHLESLAEMFPEARFIFIHRDPARSISSICSLYAYTRSVFRDVVDPRAIGAEIMNGYWPDALDALPERRARLAADRCADVRQADLVERPLEVAKEIYRALDFDWTEEARAAMTRHLETERSRTTPRHVHSLEGFGLRPEGVRERFASYCAEYGV